MCHIILVCKYRKTLLLYTSNFIKDIILNIGIRYNFNIIEMEVDKDHIHILIDYDVNHSIAFIVKMIKQISTYHIWRCEYYLELLQRNFWKEKTFWSDGYFIIVLVRYLKIPYENILEIKVNK